jgi:hypothetical protein
MPIEIKELHITVAVDVSRTASATSGGDEALRTQFGNNNVYDLDPLGGDIRSDQLALDDGTAVLGGWGASSYQWATGSDW